MGKVYKIRRKSDGLFWKPRRASEPHRRSSDVVFDEEGKEFNSSGAAKNSFIAHTKTFGTGTVRRNQPERDPNDFELVEFEQVLTETTIIELKPNS
jgi:hypothetical protein